MKVLASLGNDVFVGNFESCDPAAYDLIIHVWRRSNVPNHTCKVVSGKIDHGLKVYWQEGARLSELNPSFDEIVAYMKKPGKLLLHCVAGICRSTQLAVAALVVRGVEPVEAVRRVYDGCWNQYVLQGVPELYNYNLHEMFVRLARKES